MNACINTEPQHTISYSTALADSAHHPSLYFFSENLSIITPIFSPSHVHHNLNSHCNKHTPPEQTTLFTTVAAFFISKVMERGKQRKGGASSQVCKMKSLFVNVSMHAFKYVYACPHVCIRNNARGLGLELELELEHRHSVLKETMCLCAHCDAAQMINHSLASAPELSSGLFCYYQLMVSSWR